MIGGLLRVLVVALVLLVGAMVWIGRNAPAPAPEVATVLPEPRLLPPVTLTNRHGDAVLPEDLAGEFSLMFFGFTNCPDVCPLTLQVLANVKAALEERGLAAPQLVFVSVDPARDTPERIAAYLERFDAQMIGLTAAEDELAPLRTAMGVAAEREHHGDGGSYTVTHNPTIYVLDPEARWTAVFSPPHRREAIVSDYLRLRRRWHASSASS